MSYIEQSYQKAFTTLQKKFTKRGMELYYCDTKDEAKKQVLSLIPEGSSVTWGGSESMVEAGVRDAVCSGNYTIIDRKIAQSPDKARELYGKICLLYTSRCV